MQEKPASVITRSVAVAGGVCAPGHLGELTQIIDFDLVDAVLEEPGHAYLAEHYRTQCDYLSCGSCHSVRSRGHSRCGGHAISAGGSRAGRGVPEGDSAGSSARQTVATTG
ncbi:hypothetical protein GCM10023176_23940 [Micromonospora coerulea]|uniref:Uncharacterized protein n=1 Tax=Micromonospora coerulea TaxID=47856 RepID=A0ABP8SI68_9ACTN